MVERVTEERLRRETELAFSGAAGPPDLADLVEGGGYEEEIISLFGGKPWNKIDRTGLGEWYWAPSSLTVSGFAYYLPCFILAILEYYRPDDQLASDLLSVFVVRDPNEAARTASDILGDDLVGNVLTAELGKYLRNVAKTTASTEWVQYQEAWSQRRLSALTVPQLRVVLDLVFWLSQKHGEDFEESELDNAAAALQAEVRRRESGG